MKILNLYAGIGGNRKLWSNNHEIVAVENDINIAKIYKDFYPNDELIIDDAHEYLRLNFTEFDFIWSSPPCPTHSRLNFSGRSRGKYYKYPDMRLYEEIILLKTFFKGYWVVENVISYYEPLIKPQKSDRHYFWSNLVIPIIEKDKKIRNDKGNTLQKKMEDRNIFIDNFYDYKGDKRVLINNAVNSELSEKILNEVEIKFYEDRSR